MALPYYNSPPRFAPHPAYGYGHASGGVLNNSGPSLMSRRVSPVVPHAQVQTHPDLQLLQMNRGGPSLGGYSSNIKPQDYPYKNQPFYGHDGSAPGLGLGLGPDCTSASGSGRSISAAYEKPISPSPMSLNPTYGAGGLMANTSGYESCYAYGLYQQPTSAMRSQVTGSSNNSARSSHTTVSANSGSLAPVIASSAYARRGVAHVNEQQQQTHTGYNLSVSSMRNSTLNAQTGTHPAMYAPPPQMPHHGQLPSRLQTHSSQQHSHASYTSNGTTYFVPASGANLSAPAVGVPVPVAVPPTVPGFPVGPMYGAGGVLPPAPPALYAPTTQAAPLPVISGGNQSYNAEGPSAGGIASRLDYNIDEMAEFYANMAFGIMVPMSSSPRKVASKRISSCKMNLVQVFTATRLPKCTLFLGLVYLTKRWSVETQSQSPLSSGRITDELAYRMIIVSLLLANKVHDDHTFTNKSWHEATNIEVAELTRLEREWLKAIRWSLFVHNEDTGAWHQWDQCWSAFLNKKANNGVLGGGDGRRGSADPSSLLLSPDSPCTATTTPASPRSPYAPATPSSPAAFYGGRGGFTVPTWYKTATNNAMSPCPVKPTSSRRPLPAYAQSQGPAGLALNSNTSGYFTSQQAPSHLQFQPQIAPYDPPTGYSDQFVSYFQQSLTCVPPPPGYGNSTNDSGKGYCGWYPTSTSSVMAC